jgi:hypothetical protein
MEIKEIKDHHWTIDIGAGHIIFDLSERRAYFFKRRSGTFKDVLDDSPIREWIFEKQDISGLDVFLVIMKSLHL